MRILILLAAAALSSACIPWPHSEPAAPELTGRVTLAQTPRAGARIVLSPHCRSSTPANPCGRSGRTARTDDEGRFKFDARREFVFFIAPGEAGRCWALCVEQDMILREVFRSTPGAGVAGAAELSCELTDTSVERMGGRGLCAYHELR